MTTHPFYLLCNVTTGTESEYETVDAALDAVDRKVRDQEHWDIHEFLSGSVARWVVGGHGRTTLRVQACVDVG
ncbi:MAG: hypothetical protein ABI658_28590 [Acidimicrobiales bacterium]